MKKIESIGQTEFRGKVMNTEVEKLKEVLAWIRDAYDQANTNNAIRNLGSRGRILDRAIEDARPFISGVQTKGEWVESRNVP